MVAETFSVVRLDMLSAFCFTSSSRDVSLYNIYNDSIYKKMSNKKNVINYRQSLIMKITMVLITDGCSEQVARMWSEIGNLTSSRHLCTFSSPRFQSLNFGLQSCDDLLLLLRLLPRIQQVWAGCPAPGYPPNCDIRSILLDDIIPYQLSLRGCTGYPVSG